MEMERILVMNGTCILELTFELMTRYLSQYMMGFLPSWEVILSLFSPVLKDDLFSKNIKAMHSGP